MDPWWEDDEDDEQYIAPPAWIDNVQENRTEPGDPIGIKSVQYILMSQTQMSLSHFHTAGMSSLGFEICPSIADTMNNRYNKNNTSMKFEISGDIINLRNQLVGIQFKDLVRNIRSNIIGLPERENIWYTILNKSIENNQILRFYLDYKKLQYYNLTLQQVASIVFKGDCVWNVSPDFMGMIDIILPSAYLDTWLVRLTCNICGSENILSVNYTENKIVTVGSHIPTVSKLKYIKKNTIFTNNITEVEKYYGIEAAQSVLEKIVKSSTVSNFMTRTGIVQPFAKSSSEIHNKGLLFAMGFERPKDDIRRALKQPTFYTGRSVYTDIITGNDPNTNYNIITQYNNEK